MAILILHINFERELKYGILYAMKYIDLRSLTEEARTELRRVAVRMYQQEPNKSKISRELGIRRMTIIEWIKKI